MLDTYKTFGVLSDRFKYSQKRTCLTPRRQNVFSYQTVLQGDSKCHSLNICVGEGDGLAEGSASMINIRCDCRALQENFTV